MYKPFFSISNNLLKYISSIEASKEVIINAPLVPDWEEQFREDAVIRSVYHGTHLEGNELSKEQAERLIAIPEDTIDPNNPADAAKQAGVFAKHRDIQEILNARELHTWVDQQGTNSGGSLEYTEEMIQMMHSIITNRIIPDDQIGVYRNKQVVVRSVETGEVAFRPPLSIEIPKLMQEYLLWLNKPSSTEFHPVIRAGVSHYEIVRIHPFIEGNGRTSRALATLILYSEGYNIRRLFSIDEYFDTDIEGYYNALLSVQRSENQDLTYWLEYFAYGLALELDRIKQLVMKLSNDVKFKSKLGGQVALTERQLLILELMREHGRLTTAMANDSLPMISTDTILRDLKDLMQKGVVVKKGVTKGAAYVIAE